jgi:hypothetical protein
MDKSIIDVVEWILVIWKSEIALIIKPYFGWVEILYEYPLSYIKFSALNQQWILYVFLYYELSGLSKTVVSYIIDIIETSNASTSWHN